MLTSTAVWADTVTGADTILHVFLHPSRFVIWEIGDVWVLSVSETYSGTWTDRSHSHWSSSMSCGHRTSKTWHTASSWSTSTCGNVIMWGSSVNHSTLGVSTGLPLISVVCPERVVIDVCCVLPTIKILIVSRMPCMWKSCPFSRTCRWSGSTTADCPHQETLPLGLSCWSK